MRKQSQNWSGVQYPLNAQKSVLSWFLAVFDSKIDVCWFERSCQFFDTLSFS